MAPSAIRFTLRQAPGMQGVEVTYSLEVIVDDAEDARVQGGDVYALVAAFEEGYKAGIPDG